MAGAAIPFTAAAHRYREKIFTTTANLGTTTVDISPPGGAIKSYGYMRRLRIEISSPATGTSTPLAADAPWNIISQIAVTQPNGEEMFGGPTFSGLHAFVAAKHQGVFLHDDAALRAAGRLRDERRQRLGLAAQPGLLRALEAASHLEHAGRGLADRHLDERHPGRHLPRGVDGAVADEPAQQPDLAGSRTSFAR